MQAGDLRNKIAFYRRIIIDDGYGNKTGGYPDKPTFILSGNVRPRLGGEAVLAGRLAGRNTVNITVRMSDAARSITSDWKATDLRSGTEYNIRSIIDPDGKRQWVELLCDEGVAV